MNSKFKTQVVFFNDLLINCFIQIYWQIKFFIRLKGSDYALQ